MSQKQHFGQLLPVGTKVVTRVDLAATSSHPAIPAGAVGSIVAQPVDGHHGYRVRMVDATKGLYRRDQLTTLSAHQARDDSSLRLLADYDLHRGVIYRCIVGSRAYGLSHAGSDTDLRGIYLPPARLHWSLFGVPEQLEDKEQDHCYWEIQKFINLALKANPNILECLYTPLVVEANAVAEQLLAIRAAFLSKLAYQTYNGYVLSQFKRMEKRREKDPSDINWKHAMHLIRLLLSGIGLLQRGEVPVAVTDHRDDLLAIRAGTWTVAQIEAWRLKLHAQFEQALRDTRLPERPDYATVNHFLIEARSWATRLD
ncbi:nucleotidyltransferase domain-containing protein [Acanthopleuribacter pedis]|uniref:Nucleotidyltransferase domain-containing protein n=1 Tax=Acanthopleuribacter pedis TaxID=442870 RepID=A0A8J7U121_9BACT|nr:nucleotidyltransferase domain-containing protein [Acanthopleuribacter pedis]MBO1317087.1 nucleotidyltransferase domain-containing protein [Acanthopleuribacter pedis]